MKQNLNNVRKDSPIPLYIHTSSMVSWSGEIHIRLLLTNHQSFQKESVTLLNMMHTLVHKTASLEIK